MITHIWSLLCRRSIIDQETNTLSIHDIFEQLGVDIKPKSDSKIVEQKFSIPIEFEVISFWTKDNLDDVFDGKYIIKVKNPLGKIDKEFEHDLKIGQHLKRMRTRTKIQGFTVEKSGNYIFEVGFKKNDGKTYKIVAKIPLEINLNIKK